MFRTPKRLPLFVMSALALAAIVALSGCSLLGGASRTQSVTDKANTFHFKIPAKWQTMPAEGFISVYADDKLPGKDEPAKALSILVFASQEASTAAETDVLDYLLEARAEQRGWTDVKRGKTVKTTLGKRPAWTTDVSARGADGVEFDSRYIFARTEGREVFVVAVAPQGKDISAYDDEIDSIQKNWFWHSASEPTTDTAS